MNKSDKRLFINALAFPFLFIVIMWAVKLIEIQFDLQNIIREFGVSPRELSGMKGVLFAPFIHKDLLHLSNNSLPILILGWFLFFSYKKIANEIFLWLLIGKSHNLKILEFVKEDIVRKLLLSLSLVILSSLKINWLNLFSLKNFLNKKIGVEPPGTIRLASELKRLRCLQIACCQVSKVSNL